MNLTGEQAFIIIAMIILGTVFTRFLPFGLFPENKKTPEYILYLGKVLPFAVIGLLVVYCLKNVSLVSAPYGLPEAIGVGSTVLLHLWKKNTLLSIGGGTFIYMFLVQFFGG